MSTSLNPLIFYINSRVANALIGKHRSARCKSARILVKHNLALVLDKLALAPYAQRLAPGARTALVVVSGRGKTRLEMAGCLPCIVVGNLARDVVRNVRLADAVGERCPEPASNRPDNAWPTKQIAVQSRECTAGKGKRRGTIVGQQGIRVLQTISTSHRQTDNSPGGT